MKVLAGTILASLLMILAAVGAARAEERPRYTEAKRVTGHDDQYVYRLPYADSVSYPVLQAYGSSLSHRGAEYFTLDFGMPVGTPVYAAREGVVLRTEDRFDLSCFKSDCEDLANFVEIRHDDGTVGKYYHLQFGSVVVEPGQRIGRGERIAKSGDTGFSNAPHLHFGVYQPLEDGSTQSIAVRFAVRGGMIGYPRSGARYLNAFN